MKLSASIVFLGWTVASLLGLFGVATPSSPPGILTRLSSEGLQTVAEVGSKWLTGRINKGVDVPDLTGSFSPGVGNVEYSLNEVKVREFSLDQLTVTINKGSGFRVSIGKMKAIIGGKFSYKYTLMYIPSWNGGTVSLTASDASLSFEVTAGMNPADGLPTFDFRSCSASVENIDLNLQADVANWFLNLFTGKIKDRVKPMLKDAICDKIKNGQNMIATEVAKNIKPCLGSSCNFRIDLHFVSPPVFGENFTETAHRGEIFWQDDTQPAPYEAPPFQPLPPSSKMADLYVNAYAVNTAMYAMHKHNVLSYKFTKHDLPDSCPNALDTSCENKSLCIGNIFPSIFGHFPNASVELDFVTTSPPFLSISTGRFSIAFSVLTNVLVRNSDEAIMAVKQLVLTGSIAASISINEDALISFADTEVVFVNASISDKEKEADLFKSHDSDAIGRLQVIAKECVLPKLIAFRQSMLSVTNVGGFHTRNRDIQLIPNATVLTSDGYFANGI